MNDQFTIGDLRLNGVNPQVRKQSRQEGSTATVSFKETLGRSILNFSHHAELRLAQRGISLKPEALAKIGHAIDQAAAKGAKDSLVVYREIAMIVNIPSRTVVTAMDGNTVQGNVFTQIDSAVIVS
ncbi:flagellar biosynthesis protein [Paenibacillus sp. sptzw28]|uniref:TIGR02530 family flagellar biosynthesis protein n=1 Tax=Paenibacillus sp. sptzw28 TaxID=715179 RepID=UPI001C6E11D9|nr:TIGR02530 family flagellar biosynthesis protein [Paenibacillus sp. sptzw28]QYR19768.1 flagellar biosynthesis protein [Paenibacillus sp. sptzw28]